MNAANTSDNKVPNEKCSMLDDRCSMTSHPNSTPSAHSASSALNKPVPPKKYLNVFDIPFPKTLAELAALDATREFPYLKSLCNRRAINTPGAHPTPEQIIPIIQHRLTAHIAKEPQGCFPTTDIWVEWRIIRDDLTQFLHDLRNLLPNEKCSIPSSASSANSASSAFNKPVPHPQTSRHSNHSNPKPQKTPAIQTNPNPTPKTLGHSNNPPQKKSSASPAPSEIPTPTSAPSAPPREQKIRRNNPVLAKLTHDQKQQLIDLYQNHPAKEAVQIAREKLNIQISTGTLSNLALTWQIAEDQTTSEDLEATHNTTIETLTQQQLQLRLLELASRPNMDTGELRAICQSYARLECLKLSQRRVQLAEAKEARLIQKEKPHGPFSPEKCREGLRVMFGRANPKDDTSDRGSRGDEAPTNNPCGSRGDEAQTNSNAPQAAQAHSAHPTSSEVTTATDSDWASSGNLIT